jgi:hypothetical protein
VRARVGWNDQRKPSRTFAAVVCEEKHMGSRAIIALCRTASAASARFGVRGEETGAIWTRTGRSFFNDNAMTAHPSENAGDEDGRQQKQVERLAAEHRREQRPQDEGDGDERQ